MGTLRTRKSFFKLRSAKAKIAALDHADLRPEQVTAIATTLGVKDQEVVEHESAPGRRHIAQLSIRDEGHSGNGRITCRRESLAGSIVVEQDEWTIGRKRWSVPLRPQSRTAHLSTVARPSHRIERQSH